MTPQSDNDYKRLFSELIKKQMMVLGPEITLAKVKNVPGLIVDANGEVQSIEGEPQAMLTQIISQFVDLSGLIVKKTMESILTTYPGMANFATAAVFGGTNSKPEAPNSTVLPPMQSSTPVEEKKAPEGPPSMAEMNLESLKINVQKENSPVSPQPQKADPTSFSAKEMEDLNKALADLATAPLSSEGRI